MSYGELPKPTDQKYFWSGAFNIGQVTSRPGVLFGFRAYIFRHGTIYIQVWRPQDPNKEGVNMMLISERKYEHLYPKYISGSNVQDVSITSIQLEVLGMHT